MAATAISIAHAKSVTLPVGPFQTDHQAYPIVLNLDDYPEFSLNERAQLGVFVGGTEISSQLDDLSGDGIADQLAVLIDIRAGEKMKLKIKPVKKHKEFPQEVFAEMFLKSKTPKEGFTPHSAEGKSFYIAPVTEQTFYPGEDSYNSMHHHGVAFESSLMAYRIYFDKKQTIDVYAKKTPRLELDACKWYPTDEQLAAGFGDDILRVSGCIGVGACKPWNGQKMVHFDDVESRTERIVSQGNIRTICEVAVTGWLTESGRRVHMITRYTLYARHRDVLVEVFYSEPVEGMVTGVMQVGQKNFFSVAPAEQPGKDDLRGALVASWGTAFPVNDSVKYGKETVGLAVYVPELDYRGLVQDSKNNLVLLQPGTYTCYYFTVVSQKENCPPAKSDEEFYRFITEWAKELEEY